MVIVVIIVLVMLWYSFGKKDDPKQLVKELGHNQKVETRYITSLKSDEPSTETEMYYSDLVDEITSIKTYRKLTEDYEAGTITSVMFQELTSPLTDKIDIGDILEV